MCLKVNFLFSEVMNSLLGASCFQHDIAPLELHCVPWPRFTWGMAGSLCLGTAWPHCCRQACLGWIGFIYCLLSPFRCVHGQFYSAHCHLRWAELQADWQLLLRPLSKHRAGLGGDSPQWGLQPWGNASLHEVH